MLERLSATPESTRANPAEPSATVSRPRGVHKKSKKKRRKQVKPASLTVREKNILEAIGARELSGPQIAIKAGYAYNSALRAALSGMVKRGMIRKGDFGYRGVR
jgi:hypothetical protein